MIAVGGRILQKEKKKETLINVSFIKKIKITCTLKFQPLYENKRNYKIVKKY